MFMYTDYTQHLLDNVKKIHFIGCGGSGMYPLIQILSAKGYDISGSDVLDGSIIRSEREMGVKVTLGHSADNVVGADLVVYSAAIAKDNVELNAAASYGITTVERSVLLGYVSRLYKQRHLRLRYPRQDHDHLHDHHCSGAGRPRSLCGHRRQAAPHPRLRQGRQGR